MRCPKEFSKFSTILIFLFAITFSSYGQEDFLESRPEVNIVYIDNEPVIDGEVINDDVWNSVFPITSMTQITPNFGEPSSEKTEIRLAYTNKTFYISVIGFDSDPSKIVVSDSRRDANLND